MSMKIKEVLRALHFVSWSIPENMRGREILTLCHDSRLATPTCLFFCKVGAITDGHLYAKNAYQNGARFFVVEREIELPEDAAIIVVKNANEELSRLAVTFYGDPAKDLRLIGITGTKGKTSVALSVYEIARESGISVGYIGTNGVSYNGKSFETANTTPDSLELQKTLYEMREDGVTLVILEVSSQALWQDRIYGLTFEICAFTNLYEDHIGGVEHPDMEHYKACKKKLFTDYGAKNLVINADSDACDYMLENNKADRVITVSAKGNMRCTLFAQNAMKTMDGIRPGVSFECFSGVGSPLYVEEQGVDVFVPLPGLYSVENALITVSICMLLGIKIDRIVALLSTLRIQGRFETVLLPSRPDSLFVIDYAHNGASLTSVLKALREYEPTRIICLFGSVGGRTFGRRAELGLAAKDGADVIVVTSDNPNNEDPMCVINDINDAIGETDKPVYLIPDRKEAVEKAFEMAEAGDFVLLAGKGHETYQLIRGEQVPFSERKILERADLLSTV